MAKEKKPAGNAIDFNKIRKKRQRLTMVRRVVILLAIFGGVILVIAANNLMIEQGITTQISDLIGGMGGSGYPVSVPGGVIRDVKGAGNHLAVLNDANLLIYNDKGKQTANYQAMTDSTVLLTSEDRFLTFDVGAKKFAVHSRTKTLLEQALEYGILAGGMNQRGDFAIVSSAKQAICEITVYNKRFSKIYYCAMAENLATSVGIAPRGGMMAVGWLNGREGVLRNGVNIYQLSNDEGPAATLELGEDLILDVRFFEEDRIGVLTDKRYLVMGTDGAIKNSYFFGDRQLSAFEAEGRQMLFLCQSRETRTWEVILLDADCSEKAALVIGERVTDIALSSRRAYLLTEAGIHSYDHELVLQEETPIQFGSRIELVGSRLYYLNRDEIGVLGQVKKEQSSDPSEGDDSQLDPSDGSASAPDAENPEKEQDASEDETDPEPAQGARSSPEAAESDPDDEPADKTDETKAGAP